MYVNDTIHKALTVPFTLYETAPHSVLLLTYNMLCFTFALCRLDTKQVLELMWVHLKTM